MLKDIPTSTVTVHKDRGNLKKLPCVGWVLWLTPVVTALWDAEAGDSPEVRSLRPAWTTW